MYGKIKIRFKNPIIRTTPSMFHIYKTTDAIGIFECISEHTDDQDLAAEVAGWADLACVGEVYETDAIYAEIIDD